MMSAVFCRVRSPATFQDLLFENLTQGERGVGEREREGERERGLQGDDDSTSRSQPPQLLLHFELFIM